jgi:hypothetical protein
MLEAGLVLAAAVADIFRARWSLLAEIALLRHSPPPVKQGKPSNQGMVHKDGGEATVCTSVCTTAEEDLERRVVEAELSGRRTSPMRWRNAWQP